MIFAPYKFNILMCGGDLSIFTLHYKLFTKKTIFTQFAAIAHHIEMNYSIVLMIFAPYKVNILMCGGDLSIFTLHYKLFIKKTIFTQFVTIAHHIEMTLV